MIVVVYPSAESPRHSTAYYTERGGGLQIYVQEEGRIEPIKKVNASEKFYKAIDGIEVYAVPFQTALDWELHDRSLLEELSSRATHEAIQMGVIDLLDNPPEHSIRVKFDNLIGQCRCYLQFKE
jgi:hypothetical protein